MLALFCFLAATPTPKSVGVGLFAVVPMPLGASGAAAAIPRRNITKLKVMLMTRKKGVECILYKEICFKKQIRSPA
jgi:hypothetical protein